MAAPVVSLLVVARYVMALKIIILRFVLPD